MNIDQIVKTLIESLKGSLDHLHENYSGLQIGRASAALVERVKVESYGSVQPLKQLANISVPDASTIQIQPWDRSILSAIEKGIQLAELGLNPQNDGIVVRINIPPLTEERRRDLVKVVYKMSEEAKIAVRNARQKAMDEIKKAKNNSEISEDEQKSGEKMVQEKVDEFNKNIDESAKSKEKDILTV